MVLVRQLTDRLRASKSSLKNRAKNGPVAEWLGSALQKLLQRFESARDLLITSETPVNTGVSVFGGEGWGENYFFTVIFALRLLITLEIGAFIRNPSINSASLINLKLPALSLSIARPFTSLKSFILLLMYV